jgi:hypothetical protein
MKISHTFIDMDKYMDEVAFGTEFGPTKRKFMSHIATRRIDQTLL